MSAKSLWAEERERRDRDLWPDIDLHALHEEMAKTDHLPFKVTWELMGTHSAIATGEFVHNGETFRNAVLTGRSVACADKALMRWYEGVVGEKGRFAALAAEHAALKLQHRQSREVTN